MKDLSKKARVRFLKKIFKRHPKIDNCVINLLNNLYRKERNRLIKKLYQKHTRKALLEVNSKFHSPIH
jgi:hypothetical protein